MTHRSQPLQDKVAIVMDAAHGVGAEIARRLAYTGAQVVINYRSVHRQAAHKVEEDIFASGGRAWAVPANPYSQNDCLFLLEQTLQGFGEPDFILMSDQMTSGDTLIHQFGAYADKVWPMQTCNGTNLPPDVRTALERILDTAIQSCVEGQKKGLNRQTHDLKEDHENQREQPWLPALERA